MNSNILVENHHKDSLIAQRRVNDYMGSQTLQPYKLPMTKKLLTNVKIARFRYFQVLGERHHTKNWSEKAEKRAVFDAGIDKINKEILFQSTIIDLRAEADKKQWLQQSNKQV